MSINDSGRYLSKQQLIEFRGADPNDPRPAWQFPENFATQSMTYFYKKSHYWNKKMTPLQRSMKAMQAREFLLLNKKPTTPRPSKAWVEAFRRSQRRPRRKWTKWFHKKRRKKK